MVSRFSLRRVTLRARLIALIVLSAFLPASVLSAAPVVWCVADNDHAAIEVVLVKHLHEGAEGVHTHHDLVEHSDRTAAPDHESPCTDYDLDRVAIAAPKLDSQTAWLPASKTYRNLQELAEYQAHLSVWAATGPPPRLPRRSAALAELRTVKLRL